MADPLKTILLRWIFDAGQFDGCSIVVQQKSFIAPATFGMHFSGYDGSLLSCLETAARSGRNPLILFKHSELKPLRTANPAVFLCYPCKQFQSIRSSMLAGSWLTHGPLGTSTCLVPSHVFVACARLLLLSERHSLTG